MFVCASKLAGLCLWFSWLVGFSSEGSAPENLIFEFVVKMVSILWLWILKVVLKLNFLSRMAFYWWWGLGY